MKIRLFNIIIDNLNMSETVECTDKYIEKNTFTHLVGINADKLVEMGKNPELKRIVKESEIINADGASVVIASRLLGKGLKERIAGIDLMQELLELANKKKYSIYLLGATQEVVEKTRTYIKKKYKNVEVLGISNGYFSESEWVIKAREIERLEPDIVFVGITSPKKEYLIDYFRTQRLKSVFMGVGGSFDVLSGKIKRAPKIVQNLNLEWLYRVYQEPKRLFKRYTIGNLIFLRMLVSELMNKKERKITDK